MVFILFWSGFGFNMFQHRKNIRALTQMCEIGLEVALTQGAG